MTRPVQSSKSGVEAGHSGSASWMARIAVPLFLAWTLFVWGGRLRNLATDPGGFSEASRWSLTGAIAFVTLALLAGLALLVVRSLLRPILAALVALTVGVWLVRAVDIALGDHSIGFIVVHVVLAVVSIALGLLAWRSGPARSPGRVGYHSGDG